MMQSDIQNLLSGLLADWHIWSTHTADRPGLPGRAAGFGAARSSSQFDWENGLESDLVDKRIMQGFDASVQRIRAWNTPRMDNPNPKPRPELYTALEFEARNLAVRYQVWSSPRLPVNRQEREALILEARNLLLKELARDGVLC